MLCLARHSDIRTVPGHGRLGPGSACGSLLSVARDQWQPVAVLSELPAGTAKPFSTEAIRGVLINDKGTIRALSGVCTHLGCVLKPNVAVASLDCPCHRTVFGWDGNVRSSQLPQAPARLPAIKTRINGGQVEVFVV